MESIYSLVVVDVENGVDIKEDNFLKDIQMIVSNLDSKLVKTKFFS